MMSSHQSILTPPHPIHFWAGGVSLFYPTLPALVTQQAQTWPLPAGWGQEEDTGSAPCCLWETLTFTFSTHSLPTTSPRSLPWTFQTGTLSYGGHFLNF